MKHVITIIIMLRTLIICNAQQNAADLNDRWFEVKLSEMAYQLQMDSVQKEEFRPIYKQYCDDMIALWHEWKNTHRPQSTEDVVEVQKLYIRMQQTAQSVRLKYVDEFASVLNAKQILRVFAVENHIQRRLKIRKDRAYRRSGIK